VRRRASVGFGDLLGLACDFGGSAAFFFFSKMGVGEEKKRTGPVWQWEEERVAARRRASFLFLFGKGMLFIWTVCAAGIRLGLIVLWPVATATTEATAAALRQVARPSPATSANFFSLCEPSTRNPNISYFTICIRI